MISLIKPKNNELMHGIHITHNDADAVGCALVLSYFHPTYDFQKNTYFCSLGTQDRKVQEIIEKIRNGEEKMPRYIVISDLSLSEDTCYILEDFCVEHGVELRGFDHHMTNNLDKDYPWWIIAREPVYRDSINGDVEISATMLMYNFYSETIDTVDSRGLFLITQMISDYDTWTWRKFPDLYKDQTVEADIVGIVCSALRPEKMFKYLYEYYCDGKIRYKSMMFPDLFYTLYEIEVENRDKYLKSIHYKTKVFVYNGIGYGIVISENGFSNAVAEYLYTNYHGLDIIIIIYPASKKVSFRTNRTDINLGEIAKKYYNGGGHSAAAGGTIEDTKDLLSLLKLYYEDSIPLDEYVKTHNTI